METDSEKRGKTRGKKALASILSSAASLRSKAAQTTKPSSTGSAQEVRKKSEKVTEKEERDEVGSHTSQMISESSLRLQPLLLWDI